MRGCAGCWVGNGFCHLTPKQEYTILRESFPNKGTGSYNFVQSKAAHLYPKPPPLWDAPDSRRDDDDVTQCFNFLHNTQPIKCVTISTCKKHWSGLNISHSVMTAILCIQWFETQVLIFIILFHD